MRGESRIKSPNACFSSTGKPLIHGLSSFAHHSFSPLSHPIIPCCCTLRSLLSTVIVTQYIKLPTFSTDSLWMPPAPNSSPLSPVLVPCSFSIYNSANSSLPSLPCITGLWGRWLPVHHQGDNNTHGELQLPCVWLWRPLSDSCAAGEWSVVAHFFLQIPEELLIKKKEKKICPTLWIPCQVFFALHVWSKLNSYLKYCLF